mmetsp:Transcript_41370/g.89458  ORF Transcript_41370/g.89458 Transcript_41370/m.89458 type:complete len:601 (+) Transcript_41370:252-2054(+)
MLQQSPTSALLLPQLHRQFAGGEETPITGASVSVTSHRSFTHSPMHGPGITPVARPGHRNFFQATAVSVVAPGGGTGINGQVYADLGQDSQFTVDVVGRSRAPYDCYPEYWPNGESAPNLHSFAEDIVRQGWVEKTDLFIMGSRGGQVVLPVLWHHKGDRIPPVICINGGCAMHLPKPFRWPDAAVTFLLLGGDDYFRGEATMEEYIMETQSQVPVGNGTTAILFVQEMQHMPQQALLRSILPIMLRTVLAWRDNNRRAPRDELRQLLSVLNHDGWSGRLLFTQSPGRWAPSVDFGPFHVAQHRSEVVQQNIQTSFEDFTELSRSEELKALFRAAGLQAQPSHGAPLGHVGDRFHAAVQAKLLAAKREQELVLHQQSHGRSRSDAQPQQQPQPSHSHSHRAGGAGGETSSRTPASAFSTPKRHPSLPIPPAGVYDGQGRPRSNGSMESIAEARSRFGTWAATTTGLLSREETEALPMRARINSNQFCTSGGTSSPQYGGSSTITSSGGKPPMAPTATWPASSSSPPWTSPSKQHEIAPTPISKALGMGMTQSSSPFYPSPGQSMTNTPSGTGAVSPMSSCSYFSSDFPSSLRQPAIMVNN